MVVEDLPFAGTLPPDWSVEAYRAGQLVGFDSVGPSGRYSLTLPVQYGENPVDFVAYGPFGEVRTFNRTFRALPSMVPAGAVEYAVSAGECRAWSCDAGANLDLRYGAIEDGELEFKRAPAQATSREDARRETALAK